MVKKISVFVSLIVMIFTTVLFTCCKEEQRKYDVTIKIVNNFGKEWIFEPDTKSIDFSFEYSGKEMTFRVKEYNLPDHPRWKNKWFEPPHSGPNVFLLGEILYTDVNGEQALLRSVKERGYYSVSVIADGVDWNFKIGRASCRERV